MGLKPIKKKRLYEEVMIAIEDYVLTEGISSGDRLPSENELSSMFQVSKTAVREALSVLQANQIIEKRSGAGIFLKDLEGESIGQRVTNLLLTRKDLLEILELRRGIETEAAALAAQHATDLDLQKILEAHLNLIEANKAGGMGIEEDRLFHYSIIHASNNSIYKEVFDTVGERFDEGMRLSKWQSSKLPGRFEEAVKEHESILNALQKRDARMAAEAMRNHLIQNEKKIWSNLKRK
jgi:GntR family transcriptional regulator, transcriptional repressor for pyruvate dehydrogenase complex